MSNDYEIPPRVAQPWTHEIRSAKSFAEDVSKLRHELANECCFHIPDRFLAGLEDLHNWLQFHYVRHYTEDME